MSGALRRSCGVRAAIAAGLLATAFAPLSARAGTLIALRTLPAGAVIQKGDVARGQRAVAGAAAEVGAVAGLETRVSIYAGAPIFTVNLRSPALVERNARVDMIFTRGALNIRTEGRALDRGAAGDRIRVMNLASRTVVMATVKSEGVVTAGR